jgi:hypothetical protein
MFSRRSPLRRSYRGLNKGGAGGPPCASLLTCLPIHQNKQLIRFYTMWRHLSKEENNNFQKFIFYAREDLMIEMIDLDKIKEICALFELTDGEKKVINTYLDILTILNTLVETNDGIDEEEIIDGYFEKNPDNANLPIKPLIDIINLHFDQLYYGNTIEKIKADIIEYGNINRYVYISVCPVTIIEYILPEFMINNILKHINNPDFNGYDIFIFCGQECAASGHSGKESSGEPGDLWDRSQIDNDESVLDLIEKSLKYLKKDLSREGILEKFKSKINIYYSQVSFDYEGTIESSIIDFAYNYYNNFIYYLNGFHETGGIGSLASRCTHTKCIDYLFKTYENIIYLDRNGSILKTTWSQFDSVIEQILDNVDKYEPIILNTDDLFDMPYIYLKQKGFTEPNIQQISGDKFILYFRLDGTDDVVIVGKRWNILFYEKSLYYHST